MSEICELENLLLDETLSQDEETRVLTGAVKKSVAYRYNLDLIRASVDLCLLVRGFSGYLSQINRCRVMGSIKIDLSDIWHSVARCKTMEIENAKVVWSILTARYIGISRSSMTDVEIASVSEYGRVDECEMLQCKVEHCVISRCTGTMNVFVNCMISKSCTLTDCIFDECEFVD